jgi:hypothetical protein
MITKRVELQRVETVWVKQEDGKRYPFIQSKTEVVIEDDGVEVLRVPGQRLNAKGPDQDAGDQPDVSFQGSKIPLCDDVKAVLRNNQNLNTTEEQKTQYTALLGVRKAKAEAERAARNIIEEGKAI